MVSDLNVGGKERQGQGAGGGGVKDGHVRGPHLLEVREESRHCGGRQGAAAQLSHHQPVAAPGTESDLLNLVASSPDHLDSLGVISLRHLDSPGVISFRLFETQQVGQQSEGDDRPHQGLASAVSVGIRVLRNKEIVLWCILLTKSKGTQEYSIL